MDYPSRPRFCEWLLRKNEEYAQFTAKVLATDEDIFTRNRVNNNHNVHLWTFENPYETVRGHYQHRFSLNIWGWNSLIWTSKIIGPFMLAHRMHGNKYLEFLRNDLPM